MKTFVYSLFLFFVLQCFVFSAFSQKDIFIKEFQFELKKISTNQYENEYFVTITMNKNSMYKFTVLNHIGDFPGDAVVQILDGNQVVATNTMGDKYFEKFMFKCTKTGFYDILIHFKDNRTGSSLIKQFLVQ